MRGGSKGLKRKHLQKVNGKSLARITSETVRHELSDKVFFIFGLLIFLLIFENSADFDG